MTLYMYCCKGPAIIDVTDASTESCRLDITLYLLSVFPHHFAGP